MSANFGESVLVCEKVQEGEEDREGFLHPEESVERPFPMKLDDVRTCGDALIGDYVLAGVIALSWAVPEEESVEECCVG